MQCVVLRDADRNDAHSCQSSVDIFKIKIDCNIMKDIKKNYFPQHFQSCCCKIHENSCLLSDKFVTSCLFSCNTNNINGLGSYHNRLSASCDMNPNH